MYVLTDCNPLPGVFRKRLRLLYRKLADLRVDMGFQNPERDKDTEQDSASVRCYAGGMRAKGAPKRRQAPFGTSL